MYRSMMSSFSNWYLMVGVGILFHCSPACAQNGTNDHVTVLMVEFQGTVRVMPTGTSQWVDATNQQVLAAHDYVQTGTNSRAVLRWSDQSIMSFGANTELEILSPEKSGSEPGLHLIRGVISFFHRDNPGRIRIITRGASAGIEGTEFVLRENDIAGTVLSVIDGKVRLANAQGWLTLTNGEQGISRPGQAPVRTAGFVANNLLQWCFYYPAVIDPQELGLSADEQQALAPSLSAYHRGDLLASLALYPENRRNISDSERIYMAALLLAVGEVDKTEEILATIAPSQDRLKPFTDSLRMLIAAVKRQPFAAPANPETASECLARSYLEQSFADKNISLNRALILARLATTKDPKFGFAWERVAELEFSFGRTREALNALNTSLALAPANAQALALKGFILNSEDKPREAIQWFERAIQQDAGLGNAWLGRGIVRIRMGDAIRGREDLLVAAALEPQRSELRSYLGKAYALNRDYERAQNELKLAKRLDPNDPTPWLYSALLNWQDNQVNNAIRDLEKSQALNDNRSVYRSTLLLDQDQAVRSANLARIYQDAGMNDVARQEASRAVNADYINYSAHLFLAGSYGNLVEPGQNRFRYEPAKESEYLLANLLAPASAGTLSPMQSQRDQFGLFQMNRLGASSTTEYLSRGAWREQALQYGTFDNFSYGVEGTYVNDPGQWRNSSLESQLLAIKTKWQLTTADSLYSEIQFYESHGGDVQQLYDPDAMASPDINTHEEQEPNIILGYHHEWNPGNHTLVSASRWTDESKLTGTTYSSLTSRYANLTPDPYELQAILGGIGFNTRYRNQITLYSAELQHIVQADDHTTIIGTRYQSADVETSDLMKDPTTGAVLFESPAAKQHLDTSIDHAIVYAYHYWQILNSLELIGGISYDAVSAPENIQNPPLGAQSASTSKWSPKAGFIWTPVADTTVRFGYAQSLGGNYPDQSIRIEPTQVAGFLQNFRSILADPMVAQTGIAKNEILGLSLEQKFATGTYVLLTGQILKSKVDQTVGAFDGLWDINNFAQPGGLKERLDYTEQSAQLNIHQLVGRDWAFGGIYRIGHADLKDNYPEVTSQVAYFDFQPHRELKGTLQNLDLYAIFNHPSGFFTRVDGLWYGQDNSGYSPALPGDDFWQFDAFVGYRFLHRTAEITLGVLNLTDQDYRLNPLNSYGQRPRERTLMIRFGLHF